MAEKKSDEQKAAEAAAKQIQEAQEAVAAGKEPEKFSYVVKPGVVFGLRRLPPGSKVKMSALEAAPFADLLEPEDRSVRLFTKQELTDAGIELVAFPTASSTDRDEMTPTQRAETSQTNFETGVGPEPTAGQPVSEGAGKRTNKGATEK